MSLTTADNSIALRSKGRKFKDRWGAMGTEINRKRYIGLCVYVKKTRKRKRKRSNGGMGATVRVKRSLRKASKTWGPSEVLRALVDWVCRPFSFPSPPYFSLSSLMLISL